MIAEVNTPEYWQRIYQEEKPGWDIGHATPVFEEWLRNRNDIGHGSIAVIGCGTGHDAILFSEYGFDVTAVDFAEAPLESLKQRQANISILKADLFDLPKTHGETFDCVLEYTCFCAIDPGRRDEYVRAVHAILKPNGHLIGLFFPLDDRPGGPPFTVHREEIDRRFANDFHIVLDEIPVTSVPKRMGKERFVIFKKKS